MTNPMTPTEQDKELEAQLDKIFPCDCSFMKGFAFRPGDPCDGSCVNAPYKKAALELIIADRERVALEARLDELEDLSPELYYFGDIVKVDERIAELKALEEV